MINAIKNNKIKIAIGIIATGATLVATYAFRKQILVCSMKAFSMLGAISLSPLTICMVVIATISAVVATVLAFKFINLKRQVNYVIVALVAALALLSVSCTAVGIYSFRRGTSQSILKNTQRLKYISLTAKETLKTTIQRVLDDIEANHKQYGFYRGVADVNVFNRMMQAIKVANYGMIAGLINELSAKGKCVFRDAVNAQLMELNNSEDIALFTEICAYLSDKLK